MAESKISEGYVIALIPVLGITAVAIYRIGYYTYFGVPLEFLEIDAVKTIISGLSLGIYVFIGVNCLVWLYEFKRSSNRLRRYFDHVLAAIFFSAPTWIENVGLSSKISWPTIFFIIFFSFVTFSIEIAYIKIKNNEQQIPFWEKIEIIFGRSFWLFLLLLISISGLGAINAKNSATRIFLADTNYFVVGKSGDTLISKEYFPVKKSFDKKRTILISVGDKQVLEERSAPISN